MTLALVDVALHAGNRGRVLCRGLSARMGPGERWVVLGPNGAGKSTLLAALAGLLKPAGGRILLRDRELAAWPLTALARERAWCPAHWSDPFPATVAETVRLARRDGDDDALQAVLERFDIAGLSSVDVRSLSGGERQRVALATAWWQGAALLLLDEPTSHLDLAHQELLLQSLLAHQGTAVVSLHDLNLAWRVATHAVLFDGKGHAIAGPRDEVMTPEHLTRAFRVAVAWVEVCGERRLWIGPVGEGA